MKSIDRVRLVAQAFVVADSETAFCAAVRAARRLLPSEQLLVIDALLEAHCRLGLTLYKAWLH